MPNNVLNQLRTLRDGVAEDLRRDPRYQTLQALDKSIADITNVLAAAGLLPPGKPASSLSARLSGLAPSMDALAEPTAIQQQIAAPSPASPSSVTEELAPHVAAMAPSGFVPSSAPLSEPIMPAATETKPDFKDGTVSQAQAAVPKQESASLPTAEIAEASFASDGAAAPTHEPARVEEVKPATTLEDEDEAEQHAATAFERSADRERAEDTADEESPGVALDYAGVANDEAEEIPLVSGHAATPHEGTGIDAVETAVSADELHAHEHDPMFHAVMGAGGHQASDHDDALGQLDLEAPGVPAAALPGATGYLPMAARAGASQYAPSIAVKFGKLPNRVDLRPLMMPIDDQGELSSCVAHAVAGAYEYWIKKASKKDHAISRLFVYYNARWRDGFQDEDSGSAIQLAMEGLQKFGACADAIWPFDPRLVLETPAADAYQDGASYRIHDMARVPLKLEAWKQALAEGKPIVFGAALFGSFADCTTLGGMVPMPEPEDLAREGHGVHCMCAVGYGESEKVFIVRNCWGTDFGDAGYCYMPYDYVLNPTFNDGDCWVFVPKVPSQPPRETWQDDATPLANGGRGVDFEIGPTRIEDYRTVAVDLFGPIRRPWNAAVPAEYGDYASAVGKGHFAEVEGADFQMPAASTAIHAEGSAAAGDGHPSTETAAHGIDETGGILHD